MRNIKSSTKEWIRHLVEVRRSLANDIKRMEDITEPCGTILIIDIEELLPSTTPATDQLVRKLR